MSTVQKFSLSLLVAVVLFSAFALFAFSGLFNYIESNFYDQKVSSEIDRGLEKAAASVREFHKINFERYAAVCSGDWIRTIFLRNQSREDITTRTNVFGKLQENIPALVIIRFVDTDWRQIHYSTLGSDIRNTTDRSIEYNFFTDEGPADFIARAGQSGAKSYMVVSPEDHAFVYIFRINDRYNTHTGYGLFYVSLDGLRNYLFRNEALNLGDDIAFIQDKGLLLRSNVTLSNPAIRETVAEYWDEKAAASPAFQNAEGRRYVFFDKPLNDLSRIGIFIGDERFMLNPVMKGILLFSVFLTTFLVLFLVLSIRQDRSLVLAERIKKFQINLLREYLDRKEEIDWQKWRSELEIRRDEVHQELKHGLGKIKKKDEEKLDQLVDKSWDEIIAVLTSRGAEHKTSLEIEKLESIIEKAVANLQALPAARIRPPEIPAGKKAPEPSEEEAVEELGDELDELTQVEEVAEADGVEGIDEVEEAEDIEEAEAVEELSEAEEISEMEELSEVEELPGAEEVVEEAEAVEEAEEVEDAEPVETIEDAEEIAEADEAEDLPAAEAIEMAEDAEPADVAEAVETVDEGLEEITAPEAEEAIEERGDIEELEDLEAEAGEEPATQAEVEDAEETASLEEEAGEAVLEETSSHAAIFSENTYASLKAAQQSGPSVLAENNVYGIEQLANAGKISYFAMSFSPEESAVTFEETDQKDDEEKKETAVDVMSSTSRSSWGIDDLFSDLGVDLEQIVEADTANLSSRAKQEEAAGNPTVLMAPDGFFQYDLFLKNFRTDDSGITKSLMAISRSFPSSFFSALLRVEGRTLCMKYHIGLRDEVSAEFKLPLFGQIAEGLQEAGKAIVVQWAIKRIKEFKDLIPATEVTSEFFPLFVPVVWRKEKSYLLLCVSGLPTTEQLLGTLKGIQAKRSSLSF
ncbi:MAG: hypothetical protein LBT68_01050 [Spirochaetales bacterium]|nr:hypothetical protein [Spirochaetales bacterium]